MLRERERGGSVVSPVEEESGDNSIKIQAATSPLNHQSSFSLWHSAEDLPPGSKEDSKAQMKAPVTASLGVVRASGEPRDGEKCDYQEEEGTAQVQPGLGSCDTRLNVRSTTLASTAAREQDGEGLPQPGLRPNEEGALPPRPPSRVPTPRPGSPALGESLQASGQDRQMGEETEAGRANDSEGKLSGRHAVRSLSYHTPSSTLSSSTAASMSTAVGTGSTGVGPGGLAGAGADMAVAAGRFVVSAVTSSGLSTTSSPFLGAKAVSERGVYRPSLGRRGVRRTFVYLCRGPTGKEG